MIKKISGEIWKPLKFKGWQTLQTKYALSSSGRAASYKKNILEDGKLLEGSLTSGYRTLNLHVNGYNGTIYFHREIAKMFHKKTSSKQKYVI
ncbi:MAG: NUMOD4 domain-containing protein, partial [Ginsengibacter sp.]